MTAVVAAYHRGQGENAVIDLLAPLITGGKAAMYGLMVDIRRERQTAIGRLTDSVEQPAEHPLTDRPADRPAKGAGARAAPQGSRPSSQS